MTKTCCVCGGSFEHPKASTKTCSYDCRRAHRRAYWNRFNAQPKQLAQQRIRQRRYWHTNAKYRARLTAYMRGYMRRRRAAARAQRASGE